MSDREVVQNLAQRKEERAHSITFGDYIEQYMRARETMGWILNKIARYDMRIRRKDWLKYLLLALCMPLVYFICETYGLQLTQSPTITSLIIATNPLFAMGAGMLIFKEHFSRLNILGVFVTLAGLFLVTWTRTETGP